MYSGAAELDHSQTGVKTYCAAELDHSHTGVKTYCAAELDHSQTGVKTYYLKTPGNMKILQPSMLLTPVCVVLTCLPTPGLSAVYANYAALKTALFSSYIKELRPLVDDSSPVEVYISMWLTSLEVGVCVLFGAAKTR